MPKNRFYLGEIDYRGEIHKGEHEAVVDRELFEKVQSRLAEQTVRRRAQRSHSSSIIAGLIFDDRGNAMSPSHTSKDGVRYRYYVSQAIIQHRKGDAGSVSRVSGPDVDAIVLDAVREREAGPSEGEEDVISAASITDRENVCRYVSRVIVQRSCIEIIWHGREPKEGGPFPGGEKQTIPFDPKPSSQKRLHPSP